jgi:p-hydroxybenzoate 3-monooxygenase
VNDLTLRDTYSETVLRRVWRCTHFSSPMTTMLHTSGDPYGEQLQQS